MCLASAADTNCIGIDLFLYHWYRNYFYTIGIDLFICKRSNTNCIGIDLFQVKSSKTCARAQSSGGPLKELSRVKLMRLTREHI